MKNLILGVLILLANNTAARSEEKWDEIVNQFIGNCVQTMPHLDKVEAAARLMKWKRIEGDAATMLGPAENEQNAKLWFSHEIGQSPFIIGINSGDMNGVPTAICSISNPNAPAHAVAAALTKKLSLGDPLEDQVDAGQRMRIWTKTINGVTSHLTLTDATPMEQPGITLGIAMPEK